MAAIGIKETPSATTSELATAFDEWLDGLDTPQATLTKHNMEILAKSMRKSMALRDAMLLSGIYATSPQCKVVGEVKIDGIKTADPESIWLQTGKEGGISKERFMDYFDGRDVAYAIKLGKVKRFVRPRPLSYYEPQVHSAPQSFVYID